MMLSTVAPKPMDWFPNQKVPICAVNEWEGELDVLVATGWSTAFFLPRISAKTKCYFVQSDETRFHPDNSRWQHLTTLTYYFGVNYLTEARWIKSWLKDNFGHDAELVPNGLDGEIFFPTTPLQAKGAKPRILLEGAIGLPYKGMKEAFEAVQGIDAEVWCVSSYGHPKPEWHCDRFFEHVPMQDMKSIYSSCDILLKLSRVEGFFGPPMEMMACGGASVVGRVTGYDEYIVDGQNALVVDAHDVEGARMALQRLIDDRILRASILSEGLKTAREWEWEGSIDILESYFSKLISDCQAHPSTSNRHVYDGSITYAYEILSREILPEELISNGALPPAPHVQRLAAYLANNPSFKHLADGLRLLYRGHKFLRHKIHSLKLHIGGRS